jgi:hypothetical protein
MPDEIKQPRLVLNVDENAVQEAEAAVARFVSELQTGWDRHDAEITDHSLAANVAWGSPFGATVHGYDNCMPFTSSSRNRVRVVSPRDSKLNG